MPYVHPDVLDSGLSVLDEATATLHLCSARPTTRAEALSLSLGNKAGITISAPADRSPSGRKVTISAVSVGTVTAAGTATHYAVIDATRLLVEGTLTAPVVCPLGGTFETAAVDIGKPGA